MNLAVSYNVPYGTRITWKIINGECTTREYVASFVYDHATLPTISPFYTAKAEALESCGYEKSFVRYNVRFETPEGANKDVNVNVKQMSSPSSVPHPPPRLRSDPSTGSNPSRPSHRS